LFANKQKARLPVGRRAENYFVKYYTEFQNRSQVACEFLIKR